jgi:hypothetical protein
VLTSSGTCGPAARGVSDPRDQVSRSGGEPEEGGRSRPRSLRAATAHGSAGGTRRRLDLAAPLHRRARIPLADHDFMGIVLRTRVLLASSRLWQSGQRLALIEGPIPVSAIGPPLGPMSFMPKITRCYAGDLAECRDGGKGPPRYAPPRA